MRKLRRRFNKSSTKMSARLVQCLNQMLYDPTDLDQPENADVEVDDFEVYTKIWLKKTNRGGLLHITDESFWLFCEIEIVVHDKLDKCFAGEKQSVANLTVSIGQDFVSSLFG